jgi:hypothetical protein
LVRSGARVTTGNGHADRLAEAYYDAALPAQWLAGFAAGSISSGVSGDPQLEPLATRDELGAAWTSGHEAARGKLSLSRRSLRQQPPGGRIEAEPVAARRSVRFRLKERRSISGRESTSGFVHFAVLGDIALFSRGSRLSSWTRVERLQRTSSPRGAGRAAAKHGGEWVHGLDGEIGAVAYRNVDVARAIGCSVRIAAYIAAWTNRSPMPSGWESPG